tara:strand:- start:773 stop:1171 length:399 start_codon:yes stop_codon:yes gene_type:complete
MGKVIIDMPNKPKVEMDIKDADKGSIAEAMAGVKKATDKLLDDDPQLKAKVNADHNREINRLADKFINVFQSDPTKFLEARQEMLDTEDDWEYYEKRVLAQLLARIKMDAKILRQRALKFEKLRIVIEKHND